MTDLKIIKDKIIDILKKNVPPLKVRKESSNAFEVAGTKQVMQGKQKVDGIYFATVVPKPKDVRFYFFPIYTHEKEFKDISVDLRKCLKGKSCFYIKKLDAELEKDFRKMINKGVSIFKKEKWI